MNDIKVKSEYSSNCSSDGDSELSFETKSSSERTTSEINGTTNNRYQKTNGFRRFVSNGITKGVMEKFFRSRGKIGLSSISSKEPHSVWIDDAAFKPAKITVEKGKPLRNGYVPAEEKIVKELQEFQSREAELRKERFKSQPDLMASLDLESFEMDYENNGFDCSVIKPAKSMAVLYQPEKDEQEYSSAPASLKPARSLAVLCDLTEDELDMPGTHSLILQFENMKKE